MHGIMSFLFTTEYMYVKIRPQLQILLKRYFVNDIHSLSPCLNSNLEETLILLMVIFQAFGVDLRTQNLSIAR